MKNVQWDPKKIHATSPQKNWDWSFTNFGNKKNSVFGLWFVDTCFNKTALARWLVCCPGAASAEPEQVSMEDTAVKNVAPRMSCAVLAAAAW